MTVVAGEESRPAGQLGAEVGLSGPGSLFTVTSVRLTKLVTLLLSFVEMLMVLTSTRCAASQLLDGADRVWYSNAAPLWMHCAPGLESDVTHRASWNMICFFFCVLFSCIITSPETNY